MSKKKKYFQEEGLIQDNAEEPVLESVQEIQEPIQVIIPKHKIDCSKWSYKELLNYCKNNNIDTMWKNPQQIRIMLQKRGL